MTAAPIAAGPVPDHAAAYERLRRAALHPGGSRPDGMAVVSRRGLAAWMERADPDPAPGRDDAVDRHASGEAAPPPPESELIHVLAAIFGAHVPRRQSAWIRTTPG
jgi:hypothetical protein